MVNCASICFIVSKATPTIISIPVLDKVSAATSVTSLTTKGTTFVDAELKKLIPKYGDGVERKALDSRFWLPSEQGAKFALTWGVAKHGWIRERFDCDDHAWWAKAILSMTYLVNCVAFVNDHSSGHAYNLVLCWDRSFFWEPQPNSQGVPVGEINIGADPYKLEWGYVAI